MKSRDQPAAAPDVAALDATTSEIGSLEGALTAEHVLALQKTAGNARVTRVLARHGRRGQTPRGATSGPRGSFGPKAMTAEGRKKLVRLLVKEHAALHTDTARAAAMGAADVPKADAGADVVLRNGKLREVTVFDRATFNAHSLSSALGETARRGGRTGGSGQQYHEIYMQINSDGMSKRALDKLIDGGLLAEVSAYASVEGKKIVFFGPGGERWRTGVFPAGKLPAAGTAAAADAAERATKASAGAAPKGAATGAVKGAAGAKVASHAKLAVGLALEAALLAVDLILSELADRLEEANQEGLRHAWKLTVLPLFEAKMQEELANALLLVNPEPRWITVRWRSVMEVQDRELADAAVALLRLISLQGTFVEIFDHIEVEDVFVSPDARNEAVTARDRTVGRSRHYVFESSVLISDPAVSKRWWLEDAARTYARDQWGRMHERLDDPERVTFNVGVPLVSGDYAGAAQALGEFLEEQPLDDALRDDLLEFRNWLEQEAEDRAAGRAELDEHQRGLLEVLEQVLPQRLAELAM
jgi:hypothetical protein